MQRPGPRRVMWVSGIAWMVSWSFLGLEIFPHWHHVTKTLHRNPPKGTSRASQAPARALPALGSGRISARPAVFLTAIATRAAKSRKQRREHPRAAAQQAE